MSGKDFEKKTGTGKAETINKRGKKVDIKGTRENLKCRIRKRNKRIASKWKEIFLKSIEETSLYIVLKIS